MTPIDINRLDYYDRQNDDRTRVRLQELIDKGIYEVGVAEFGVKNVFSGLYVERLWNFTDEEWNDYITWATGLMKRKFTVDRELIPKENILAIVKFDKVPKKEFLEKAGEIVTYLKTEKERTPAEKLVFGNHNVDILIYGTVKGVPLNEIWFVKSPVLEKELEMEMREGGVLTGSGEIVKENIVHLSDETLAKWKQFLEEDRIATEKKKEQEEKMAKIKADPNYEKYRDEICLDGRKESDFGFEMLFYLHKHLAETPVEELQKEFDAVKDIGGSDSPTVEEYFENINPEYQYQKGYSEGAKCLIEKLEKRLNDDERPVIPVDEIVKMVKDIYDNE